MANKRPSVWDRQKNWLRKHSEIPNWVSVAIGGAALILAAIQIYQGSVMIADKDEEQRPRLSLRIELEPIDAPTKYRIIAPLEIGGTTDARRVMAKDYVTSDKPGQRDYISAIDVDWDGREGHLLGDVSSTEEGRRITAQPLSQPHIKTILSTEESLYIIVRLEYCDVTDNCYYFMRCAEVGNSELFQALVYCGTRLGHLTRD